MSTAMTTRDRFWAVMNFQPFDRLPLLEWAGWWNLTIDRWHQEGLPADCTDRYDICRHFGLDIYLQQWFAVRTADCPQEKAYGQGILTCQAEYNQIRKHLYPDPFEDKRQIQQWQDWAEQQAIGDAVLWFTLDGFFWFPRALLGIEGHLYAFFDQPELLHQINRDLAQWHLKIIDRLCEICTPDFMTFGEDMSYNNGPMLSKNLFDEFLLPYYAQVTPELKRRGILPLVDTDGDVAIAAQWFEEANIAGILPLERQAGVDIVSLRRNHPRLRFVGHFDKLTMNQGEAALRAEFERLLPVAAQGGFIPACDHQTPPSVSYHDYQLYRDLFQEYAQQIGRP